MPMGIPGWLNPQASFRARRVIVVGLVSLATILALGWLAAMIATDRVRHDEGVPMAGMGTLRDPHVPPQANSGPEQAEGRSRTPRQDRRRRA